MEARTAETVIEEIVDRPLGGYESTIDNKRGYSYYILDHYLSAACPEPLNTPFYQGHIQTNLIKIRDEIYARVIKMAQHLL